MDAQTLTSKTKNIGHVLFSPVNCYKEYLPDLADGLFSRCSVSGLCRNVLLWGSEVILMDSSDASMFFQGCGATTVV